MLDTVTGFTSKIVKVHHILKVLRKAFQLYCSQWYGCFHIPKAVGRKSHPKPLATVKGPIWRGLEYE